ncbi:MAG: FxLYD domain-containing protein [Bacteroidota bacterium]
MRVRLVLLALLAAFVFAGCAEERPAKTASVVDLKLLRLPNGTSTIQGVLVNPNEVPIRNAQIEIALYDSDNQRLDALRFDITDVEPGDRRAFERELGFRSEAASASVGDILIY